MEAAVAWILSLLLFAAPPDRITTMPGWDETAPERAARYESIARDIATVVYDPKSQALYAGPHGRARTAALLVSVAVLESGLAKDVDVGPCYRGRDGKDKRCDSGRAFGLWQVHDPAVAGNRLAAARRALKVMRGSFAWSAWHAREAGWPEAELDDHRLDAYAGGSSRTAFLLGRARLAFGKKLAGRPGAPRDVEVGVAAPAASSSPSAAPVSAAAP